MTLYKLITQYRAQINPKTRLKEWNRVKPLFGNLILLYSRLIPAESAFKYKKRRVAESDRIHSGSLKRSKHMEF